MAEVHSPAWRAASDYWRRRPKQQILENFRDAVARSGAKHRPSTTFAKTLRKLASKLFAARGLGRFATKKWQAQDFGDNRLEHPTRGSDPAVAIVRLVLSKTPLM